MLIRASRPCVRLCSKPTLAAQYQRSQPRLNQPRHVHSARLPGNNNHIYYSPKPESLGLKQWWLTLLDTTPVSEKLALGSTTAIPPTPSSFTTNPSFLPIVQSVLAQYATQDPIVQAAAGTYASETGFTITSTRRGATSSGAGPTAFQGGSGGGGRGGWVHVSDQRRPPDWGRIADPEDILGSVEVDSNGDFVGQEGNYQESGTYRVLTNDGILCLSPFLLEKLQQKLRSMQ